MAFSKPTVDEFEITGYVGTSIWDAEGIATQIGRETEEQWNVSDSPVYSYGGGTPNFKVTIKVEKV